MAVVGGGIAGLAAAWELAGGGAPGTPGTPGARVTVLEADGRLGGKIERRHFAGRHVDLGPDAFVARRPEAVELCQELGLGDELVTPAETAAYVMAGGRLRRLPAGLALGVPTRLGPLARSGILSPAALARAALDVVLPRHAGAAPSDAAVGPLVAGRLGRQVVERLADPLVGGIHAGSVEEMSAAAVFPDLLRAAGQGGSLMRRLRPPAPSGAPAPVFRSLRGGLAALVDHLAEALGRAGVELRTGCEVRRLERRGRWVLDTADGAPLEADAVVLAVPAPRAAALVAPHDAGLAELLGALSYASVTLVTLRFATGDVPPLPPGTGYLVPRTGGAMVTACTWMSAKWPELARPGDVLVRASLGRFGDDRALAMDDDALVGRAVAELTPALGLRGGPTDAMVARFPLAFPQYTVGHLDRVAAMEQAAGRLGGLALAGAALRGVGIPACIASGRRAARSVVGHLEGPGWR
ncbi:MAG: protoporphyrinogen oxidase [Acidobacteriota bacterium]|nr:protoporphyrinogen oxidase [Acidobacteriota bacterium]